MARPGFTIWFTGLSGAGKSTLAALLEQRLKERGHSVEVLDGDIVRMHLSKGLGFSREDRDTNIKRIAFVCSLLTRNGVVCISAAISPYREAREWARQAIENFVEVYVKCPVEVCRQRDVKGLYRLVDEGKIKNFTGVDDPYEEPEHPELVIETDNETVEESAARILAGLEELGYLEAKEAVCDAKRHKGATDVTGQRDSATRILTPRGRTSADRSNVPVCNPMNSSSVKRGNVTQTTNDISVIICAYSEDRWGDLIVAVESVRHQTLPPKEIVVVIDHNPALLKRARSSLAGVVVVENTETQGLRGARNSGIAAAKGQILAFLDDDAQAIPNWLMVLGEGYADPHVLGTGGAVTPFWEGQKPAWLPEEFYWVVGCSYRGMPQTSTAVRNLIGANMSFRREVFDAVGDFHSEIGQIGTRHAGGCEETELCIRARQHWPQSVFLYQPQANVLHRVPATRTCWRYFCARCYVEGLAKADVARYVGAKDGLASERTHALRTLPQGVVRGLIDTLFHHDLTGLARAGAIVVGLAMTTAGYLVGRTSLRLANLMIFRSSKKGDVQCLPTMK